MKITFNPENKASLTYRDSLAPAMEITSQEEADQYYEDYVAWQMKFGQDRQEAERIVKTNLGYYAGYYSNEVRQRVEKLFKCSHPIFGSVKENGIPTAVEALECGRTDKTLSEVRKT